MSFTKDNLIRKAGMMGIIICAVFHGMANDADKRAEAAFSCDSGNKIYICE